MEATLFEEGNTLYFDFPAEVLILLGERQRENTEESAARE